MSPLAQRMLDPQRALGLLRGPEPSEPPGQSWAGPPGTGPEPTLVHEPGGDVMRRLQHPAFKTIEQMRRAGPPANGSWFHPSVSSKNLVQVDLLSYTVPRGQQLWIFDYEFTIYRQSGLDPAGLVVAEEGRFATTIGFDVTVNGSRMGALLYGLEPVPTGLPGAASSTAPQAAGSNASYLGTPTQGLSLLPARSAVQGARGMPFTLIAEEGSRVVLTAVIFNRLRCTVGAIEGKFGGYLVGTNFANSLVARMRPR